jgi:hypothetical protein
VGLMMDTIWRSNLGRLFLGGCGTQLGLAVTLIALASMVLFCSVCALTNVASIAITQQVAGAPPNKVTVAEASEVTADNGEVEALQAEIESLVSQVELLQATEPEMAAPPAVPAAAPNPVAIAHKGRVNLRSGPGTQYNGVGTMSHGDSLEIVGRNPDSSWWLVAGPEGMAWVSADWVLAYNVDDSVPVVTVPALLVWPGDDPPDSGAAGTPTPDPPPPTPGPPPGTPTATAAESRIFVEDTPGYQKLREQLSRVPTSASFSPQGDQIAITEGIKLYLVKGDGSHGEVLLEDDDVLKPVGGAVWSPDGKYMALVVEKKECVPCRSVALIHLAKNSLSYLQAPDNLSSDTPRWTQDGRLVVNVHPGEPADGTAYIYHISGRGQVASGTFLLSSSHDGQKWLPWRPGRTWRAGFTQRPDTYYGD